MPQPDNHKGSLLFVSIDFPPARTSGIYRPVFFTKYLIEAGWKVTLLTATTHLSTVKDESLYKEIHPDLEIIRASAPMPRAMTGKLYDRYRRAAETPGAVPGRPSLKNRVFRLIKKGILSPGFRLVDNFLLIPDNYIIWAIKNLPKAYRLIRKHRITHLLVTSPQSVQIMGILLSYLTHVRYITDFRNSWTDNQPYEYRLRGALERSLERKVLHRSRAVINMSAGDVDRLLARMPDFPRKKLHVVTNGYNEADFAGPVQNVLPSATGPLTLLYVGTMYPHSGDSTAAALHRLAERGCTAADIELTIIGFADESFQRLVETHGVRDLVKNVGFMAHDDLMRAYPRYDCLYLLTGGTPYYHRGALPGKIFEYMRLGKPILHAGIEGTTHDMLARSGLETFAPLDKPEAIAARMKEMMEQKKAGRLTLRPNHAYIQSYEWRRLAACVDNILRQV